MVIKDEEITIDDFFVYKAYEKAIDYIANSRVERDSKKSYIEEKRQLLDRYSDNIQALINIGIDLKLYKKTVESETNLENLDFRLKKSGINSKICKKNIRENEKKQSRFKENIIKNAKNTNNLPVTSKYIKDANGYELQEANNHYLYTDAKVVEDFCKQLFSNIKINERGKRESFQYFKKLSQYAAEKNMSVDTAKESFEAEELNKKIRENNYHLMDIETIKSLLVINPDQKVIANISDKEFNALKSNIQFKRQLLNQYESDFINLSELKEQQKELEETLKYLNELDNSAMDLKSKNKLENKIQKDINKKTRRIEKIEMKLIKMQKQVNIKKYFDNINYYESVVKANKALEKEDSADIEKIEKWKKLNEEFWIEEIIESNAKNNKQNRAALPNPASRPDERVEFLNRLNPKDNPNANSRADALENSEKNLNKDIGAER